MTTVSELSLHLTSFGSILTPFRGAPSLHCEDLVGSIRARHWSHQDGRGGVLARTRLPTICVAIQVRGMAQALGWTGGSEGVGEYEVVGIVVEDGSAEAKEIERQVVRSFTGDRQFHQDGAFAYLSFVFDGAEAICSSSLPASGTS